MAVQVWLTQQQEFMLRQYTDIVRALDSLKSLRPQLCSDDNSEAIKAFDTIFNDLNSQHTLIR